MIQQPVILLVSQSRSGSTLLRACINAIPNVYIQGENDNLVMKIIDAYASAKRTAAHCKTEIHYDEKNPEKIASIMSAWENDFNLDVMTQKFRKLIVSFLKSKKSNIESRTISTIGFKEIRIGLSDSSLEKFESSLLLFRELFPLTKIVFLIRENFEKCIESHSKVDWFKEEMSDMSAFLKAFKQQALFFREFHKRHPQFTHLILYEDICIRSRPFQDLFTFLTNETSMYKKLKTTLDQIMTIKYQKR